MDRQNVVDFIFSIFGDSADILRDLKKDADNYWTGSIVNINNDGSEHVLAHLSVPDWYPEGYTVEYT